MIPESVSAAATLLQQLANGLMLGLVYTLLALGFSLMYSTTRVINFAHGEMFTLGAFAALAAQRAGLPYPMAAFGGVVVVACFGYAVSAFVLQRLASALVRSVTTIALGLALRDGMLLLFGSDTQSFPGAASPGGVFRLAGASISRVQVWIMGSTVALVAVFGAVVWKTRLGVWMRATAQDRQLAATAGVPTSVVSGVAFALGAGMAAAAGVLVGPVWQVSYGLGGPLAVKAFTAALVGGLGDLRGAVAGGMILGLLEAMFAGYVSSTWKDVAVFGVLIVTLVLFPQGIVAPQRGRVA